MPGQVMGLPLDAPHWPRLLGQLDWLRPLLGGHQLLSTQQAQSEPQAGDRKQVGSCVIWEGVAHGHLKVTCLAAEEWTTLGLITKTLATPPRCLPPFGGGSPGHWEQSGRAVAWLSMLPVSGRTVCRWWGSCEGQAPWTTVAQCLGAVGPGAATHPIRIVGAPAAPPCREELSPEWPVVVLWSVPWQRAALLSEARPSALQGGWAASQTRLGLPNFRNSWSEARPGARWVVQGWHQVRAADHL